MYFAVFYGGGELVCHGCTLWCFTEIEGLSANSGSTEGGLMLTVTGQYFDDTDSPARVLIDGEECRVQEPISSTAIVCEISTPPASTPSVHTGESSC